MHMSQSQELESASRSSETYLAENGGGRPASVHPRSCIRVQEGTGQNYLARTHGNGYVTDKPRMMMMMTMYRFHNSTYYCVKSPDMQPKFRDSIPRRHAVPLGLTLPSPSVAPSHNLSAKIGRCRRLTRQDVDVSVDKLIAVYVAGVALNDL